MIIIKKGTPQGIERERERERDRESERETESIIAAQNNAIRTNYVILFTNPSARAGYDTRSIFKRSLAGLNSEFSFSKTSCLTKAEEPSPSYYLPIAGGRIIGFIPFPRVLVLCEMKPVSSRYELVSPCPFPTTITITNYVKAE